MQHLPAALPPTRAFLAGGPLASDRLQFVRALRYGLPYPGFSNRPAAALAAAQRAATALLPSKSIGASIGPSLELFTAIIAADIVLSALSTPADYLIFDAKALPKLPAAGDRKTGILTESTRCTGGKGRSVCLAKAKR